MVIKVVQTVNTIRPSSDVSVNNPSAARRTGEAISQVGENVSNLGQVLSRVVKSTDAIERENAKQLALRAGERFVSDTLASGVLTKEEIQNGVNKYSAIRSKMDSFVKEYSTQADPRFTTEVENALNGVFNNAAAPMAKEVAQKSYNSAIAELENTYSVTASMIKENPSTLQEKLGGIELDVQRMVGMGLIKGTTKNEFGDIEQVGNEDEQAKKIGKNYIENAALGYAEQLDLDSAVDAIENNGNYFDGNKERADMIKKVQDTFSYYQNATNKKESIIKIQRENKDIKDTNDIAVAAIKAQASGDLVKASEIEASALQLAAGGKISARVVENVSKRTRFNYQTLDPQAEYGIASMISKGISVDQINAHITDLAVVKKAMSPEAATKWVQVLNGMREAEKVAYFSQGLGALNTMFGTEDVLGDVFDTAKEPQRRAKIKAINDYIALISSPNFKGNGMDAANAIIAKMKGDLPIVSYVPAKEQGVEMVISPISLYNIRAMYDANVIDEKKYNNALNEYEARRKYEDNRLQIQEGAKLLKALQDNDIIVDGFIPYTDPEAKRQAETLMLGR